MEESLKPLVESAGLDWSKVKEGAVAFLPFAEFLAKQTATDKDDQFIAFVRLLLAMPQPMGGLVRDDISQFIRERLRARAIRHGADPALIDKALDKMESDRPWLDWLKDGGWEQLLKILLMLIPLFVGEADGAN